MATTNVMHGAHETLIEEHHFSRIDRYFLRHFHPRRIILDIIASMWATYFLWQGNWVAAVACVAVFGGLGLYFTRNVDPELMAQTTLGRLGLLHKQPVNFLLNLIGSVPLVYGLWEHSGQFILIGLSIIFLGHFFGWSEVNKNLKIVNSL